MKLAKIMVIESDLKVALCLSHVLQPSYHVKFVCEAESALSATWQFQPDILLLDLEMPLLAVEDFAQTVSSPALHSAPEILFITTDTTGHPSRPDVLVKPFQIVPFLSRVTDLLERRRRRRSGNPPGPPNIT